MAHLHQADLTFTCGLPLFLVGERGRDRRIDRAGDRETERHRGTGLEKRQQKQKKRKVGKNL